MINVFIYMTYGFDRVRTALLKYKVRTYKPI
jgi:hypothetical protein